jgi:predicted porin
MKKLLLTSALVGSTLLASNAIAQTTVTGNLNISYKTASLDKAASQVNGGRGFGNEQQLNIQTKGKLNNGMDYAAGFSIENDSAQSGTLFNENVYIDFIAGNTTFTVGVDHIQNSDRTLAGGIGLEAQDLALGAGASSVFVTNVGSNVAGSYGFGVTQTIPGIGKLSALYVPTEDAQPNSTDGDKTFAESNEESAYEIGFVGDFGVKGLNTHAFKSQKKATTGSKAVGTALNVNDVEGTNLGASYNFGQVTVGYTYKKEGAATVNSDTKQDEFSAAYALSPTLSISANYTKADKQGTGVVDAKAKTLGIGYSLGPVALVANYSKLENYTGTSGDDADVIYLAARTSF